LRQKLAHQLAVHVSQPEIAAGVTEDQVFVIQAEQVENRRLQIVHVDLVLHDMEAKLIGSAVSEAALDATAGHPDGKGLRMMIAAEPAAQSRIGFDHRRTAELAAPDDQRLIEQTPSFEVGNESGTRLIGVATVF